MATRTIYASSSNHITCSYSLNIARSGSKITLTAAGTIYGNGSSKDSDGVLYAHICYNVSPANTTSKSATVTSYGTRIGTGVKIVSAPLNGSTIPTSGKKFSASWTITSNEAKTYNNCALFISSSSTDASDYDGESYRFVGKRLNGIGQDGIRYYTETLSIGAGYEKCTAPTTIKISTSSSSTSPGTSCLQKPGTGSGHYITLFWRGATGGTNNSIEKYNIYYSTTKDFSAGSTLQASKKSGDYTTKQLSDGYTYRIHTFSLDSTKFIRGKTYYFKIISIGSATTSTANWNSPLSTASATVTVNSLPGPPTVSFDYTTVPSSGKEVKVTEITAKDANNDNNTYYFSTSEEGTSKTAFSTGKTFNITSKTTYYFWTKDSLGEFSEKYSYQTFDINAKPTVSLTVTPTSKTATTNTTGLTYALDYSLKGTIQSGKKGILKFYYSNSSSKETKEGTLFSSIEIKSGTTGSTSINIMEKLKNNAPGKYIRFKVIFEEKMANGLKDTSDEVLSTNYYYIAPWGTATWYNTNSNSNVTDSNTSYFNNYVRCSFQRDNGITKVTYTINCEESAIVKDKEVEYSLTSDNKKGYIDIKLNSDDYRGKEIEFIVKLYRTTNCSKTYTIKKTKIIPFSSTSLVLKPTNNYILYPLIEKDNKTFFTFELTNFINSTSDFELLGFKNGTTKDSFFGTGTYDQKYNTEYIYFDFSTDSSFEKAISVNPGNWEIGGNFKVNEEDGTILNFNFAKGIIAALYNYSDTYKERLGFGNLTGSLNLYGRVRIRTAFEGWRTIDMTTNTITLDFDHNFSDNKKIIEVSNFNSDNKGFQRQHNSDDIEAISISSTKDSILYFRENNVLTFKITYETYNTQTVKAVFSNLPSSSKVFDYTIEKTTEVDTNEITGESTKDSITYTYTLNEITSSFEFVPAVKVTIGTSEQFSSNYILNENRKLYTTKHTETSISTSGEVYEENLEETEANYSRLIFNYQCNSLNLQNQNNNTGGFSLKAVLEINSEETLGENFSAAGESLNLFFYSNGSFNTNLGKDGLTGDDINNFISTGNSPKMLGVDPFYPKGTDNEGKPIPWESWWVRVKLTTTNTFGTNFNVVKTTYSTPFKVYNIAPTVSYRPNCLAINVKDFNSAHEDFKEAILVLNGGSGGRNAIICKDQIIISGGTW